LATISKFSLCVLVLILIAFAISSLALNNAVNNKVNISTNMSHAPERHGDEGLMARECNAKPDITLVRGDNDNRRVNLCLIKGVGLAIQILEKISRKENGKYVSKWEELTAYINKNKLTVSDMIDYAEEDMISSRGGMVTFAKEEYKLYLKEFLFP
jgi:hypothetical protein